MLGHKFSIFTNLITGSLHILKFSDLPKKILKYLTDSKNFW